MDEQTSGMSEALRAKLKWLKEMDDSFMDDAPVISGPKPRVPEGWKSDNSKREEV